MQKFSARQTFGRGLVRKFICIKYGIVRKFVTPKIFLTDMHMCSVNSMTKTGTETRSMKANLNHGMKIYRKHAKF